MNRIFPKILLLILVAVYACKRGPVPDEQWMLKVVSVSVVASDVTASLQAELSTVPSGQCECGFYYGGEGSSMKKVKGTFDGRFISAEIEGLKPANNYICSAYLFNGRAQVRSNTLKFETEEYYDFIQIGARPSVDAAVLQAVLKDVPTKVKGAGFYYGLSEDEMVICPGQFQGSTVSLELKNLEPGTLYYFKAYVTAGKDIVCSVVSTFSTLNEDVNLECEIDEVTVSATETTAEMEAFISGEEDDVTVCGFYYGTDPTRLRKALSVISDGGFYLSVSGLSPGTRYYYKAFVANDKIEKTSDLGYFDTIEELEFIRVSARKIEGKYVLEAELADEPSRELECGFIYGTSASSTQSCLAGLSRTVITSDALELQYETEYLFRAYVKTAENTSLSVWGQFQTDAAPSEGEGGSGGEGEENEGSGGESEGESGGEGEGSGDGEEEGEGGTTDPTPEIQPDPNDIVFKDRFVKEVCVAWFDKDGDGELSYDEAAQVTKIPAIHSYYSYHQLITSFDELQYFTSLKEADFYGCSNLESIVIPEGVTILGGGGVVLAECRSLKNVVLPSTLRRLSYMGFTYCSALEKVKLPFGLTEITCFAFDECTSLKEIDIPFSVQFLDGAVFPRCFSLEKFSGRYASADGSCLIVNGALKAVALAGLTEYTIPAGVSTLGEYLFDSCASLKKVVLPQTVSGLDFNVFIGCSNLESFEGKFVSEDGRCVIVNDVAKGFAPAGLAFYEIDCEAIEDAFSGCRTITELTFGPSVKRMHEHAVYNCYSLKAIRFKSETPPVIYHDTTIKLNPIVKIYVPESAVETYRTDPGWSQYAEVIFPDNQ